MAKQIYISENGNEQLISGTINNASLLPISASDSTPTKDYIDSKASACFPNYWSLFADQNTSNTLKTLNFVEIKELNIT